MNHVVSAVATNRMIIGDRIFLGPECGDAKLILLMPISFYFKNSTKLLKACELLLVFL